MFFDYKNGFHENFRRDIEMKQKKESDVILIQKKHRVKITTTKNQFVKAKVIEISSMNIATILKFVKIKFGSTCSKKKQVNVYVSKTCILNSNYDKNVFIKHKFLAKETYFFEPIRQKNEALKTYLSAINSVITEKTDFIFMTNLKETRIKIVERQLIERLKQIEISKKTSNACVKFDYADVFINKHIENEFDSTNFFVIDFENLENQNINFDINDH